MSATAAFLPCPICAHSGVFESVHSLRDRLIHVSTNKMLCPVCQEEVTGLDKLTIHLFSHVKIMTTKNCLDKTDCKEIKTKSKNENEVSTSNSVQQQKPLKTTAAKNKTTSPSVIAPMKYVKIYPKLPIIALNAVPVIDISRGSIEESRRSLSVPMVKTESTLIPTNTICNVCGLQFVDADILRMHKCLIHNMDDTTNQNVTHYQCHLCPKNFKMRGSLMVHLRVAHFGFLSGNCNSGNSKESAEGNSSDPNGKDKCLILERNDNKQWQCDVCRKSFTTKYFLKKHKRLHTGETPYACSQCNKTFTFQQSYHKHLLYHNDEKPHTCNFCGRAFKELSTLHNHQRIHTGEKPFSCETCGKCFRQRVSYLVHRRIHTGVMPYKCTACEKSFRYKVSQRTHKCQSKPPGTVVRQSGNLVEKLKKKHINSDEVNIDILNSVQKPPQESLFPEVSEANAELVLTSAKLSLEDMESDNFTLISEHFEYNNQNTNGHCDKKSHIPDTQVNDEININTINPNLDELIDSIHSIDKNIPSPSEILKNLCLSREEDYTGMLTQETEHKNYNLYNDFNALL